MDARIGPTHGIHANASAAPSPAARRTPGARPLGSNRRSRASTGSFSAPASDRPMTTIKTPDSLLSTGRYSASAAPIVEAVATSATKTTANPRTNSSDWPNTRADPPGTAPCDSPSDTPETYDRYPGMSGMTHGDRNDTVPARNAIAQPTGGRSGVIPIPSREAAHPGRSPWGSTSRVIPRPAASP